MVNSTYYGSSKGPDNQTFALIILLILFIIAFLPSCTSIRSDINQGIKEDVYYKKDMKICVNGLCGEGVLVVPEAEIYNFEVESYGNLDLFTFATCHREDTTSEFATKKRWYGKRGNREAKGVYRPTPGLEDVGSCPAYLGGWSEKGRHSWGFIDFESSGLLLKSKLYCGGSISEQTGVSVCQSKKGLIQLIEFEESVNLTLEETDPCYIEGKDKKRWEFPIKRGQCVYAFYNKKYGIHRLTTIGYDEIIVRGE